MFRSDLIPHLDFHKGYWFKSTSSNWYYFKELPRDYKLSPYFNYTYIDDDLLGIVKYLHKNNIYTTPSCSGHNYTKEHFQMTYRSIKAEEKIIQTKGLPLINTETLQKEIFLDKNYTFKYTEEEFINLAVPYSSIGILGIQGDFSYLKDIVNLEITKDRDITLVKVINDNKNTWKSIESKLLSISR